MTLTQTPLQTLKGGTQVHFRFAKTQEAINSEGESMEYDDKLNRNAKSHQCDSQKTHVVLMTKPLSVMTLVNGCIAKGPHVCETQTGMR